MQFNASRLSAVKRQLTRLKRYNIYCKWKPRTMALPVGNLQDQLGHVSLATADR